MTIYYSHLGVIWHAFPISDTICVFDVTLKVWIDYEYAFSSLRYTYVKDMAAIFLWSELSTCLNYVIDMIKTI